MKKTITRFLLLSLTVASLGGVTSCKDYDEDRMNEIESRVNVLENAKLQDAINEQKKAIADLNDLYAQLKAALDVKVSCECGFNFTDAQKEYLKNFVNWNLTQAQVEQLKNLMNYPNISAAEAEKLEQLLKQLQNSQSNNLVITPENFAEQFKQQMENPEFKQIFQNYITEITTIACDCGDLKTKVAALETAVNANTTNIADLTTKYNAVNALLESAQADATKALETAEKAVADAAAAKTQADEALKVAQEALAKAGTGSGVSSEELAKLQAEVDSLKKVSESMGNSLKTVEDNYTKIDADVKSVLETIKELDTIKTDLQKAQGDATAALTQAQANKTAIEALQNANFLVGKDTVNISYRLDTLANVIADAQTLIEKISVEQAKQAEALKTLGESVDANTTSIKEINEKIINELATKESVTALEKKYDALKEEADKLRTEVDDLTKRLTNLESQVAALAKQVTGITIQQVYNPAFGNISLPVGVNTNVLMALYGEASQDYVSEFPNRKFINVDPVYTIKAQGQMLLDKKTKATAGKVYLTVNPSNVDFSGLTLDLVNSQDVNAPVQLSPLALSDKTLKFGYTRAGNNFYESEATVSKADIEAARLKVDKGAIASALKETVSAIKNRDASKAKVAAADMASVIYKTAQSLSLDAEAVKATVEENGRTVTSEYAIAACAIKPLMFNSFDAIANKQLGNLPLYTQATNLINEVHDKVVSGIKRGYKKMNGDALVEGINNLTIRDIQLQELDENLVAKFRVEVSQTIDLAGRKIKFDLDKDVELPIHLTTKADLSGLTFNIPTIVVAVDGNGVISSDDKNSDAAVWVPIVDEVTGEAVTDPETGNPIGGYIPATNVTVKGNGEAKDVTVVAPDGTIVDIDFNETVKTHLSLKDVEITIPASDDFKFEFTQVVDLRDQIKDIFGTVQNQIGSVNNMLQDVRDVVDAARDLIDDINSYENRIIDKVDSYAARVQDYLDKINNKAVNGINKVVRNLPRLLQPTVLVNSDAGLVVAGFESAKPVATGKVQLIATSYTGELLCPFLAKVVTVNGQVQKIGEGGVIDATNVKKGVNVVKYAALDYSGVERDITYYFLYK